MNLKQKLIFKKRVMYAKKYEHNYSIKKHTKFRFYPEEKELIKSQMKIIEDQLNGDYNIVLIYL